MRIIAGTYRGKKLFTPVNFVIRPTSDKARESIFNILSSRFERDFSSLKILDIFAGTGAFGLEAISRGFEKAALLDIDVMNAQKNAKLFSKEQDRIKVIRADATKLGTSSDKYDIVFMDAPYKKGLSSKVLLQLIEKNWLAENALVIVETERNEALEIPAQFELEEERFYGIAKFSFLSLI